jgi:8-oxo-dGTP pyrophosphatase MutT (NUDIX family)
MKGWLPTRRSGWPDSGTAVCKPVADIAVTVANPAASLIVVRDGRKLPEVLLLKRSHTARFMPNLHVFPGGRVDEEDQSERMRRLCAPSDDAWASEKLGLSSGGLGYFVAAIRETFEESGLLFAYESADRMVDLHGYDESDVRQWRMQLATQHEGLSAACEVRQWRLAVDCLRYYSHWITPTAISRRFDTRFFIARAPEQQTACLASEEMSDLLWCAPRDALNRANEGQLSLALPTLTMLTELAAFPDAATLFASLEQPRTVVPITPQ